MACQDTTPLNNTRAYALIKRTDKVTNQAGIPEY